MFSSGQGSFKASCNGKCFLREVEVSQKQTEGHTWMNTRMHTRTIVPSWFDVSHSQSHFYLKSQISINTGLDCCEKIAAGLVPTHLCEPLRALWIDYTSSLVYTLYSPPHGTHSPYLSSEMLLKIPTSAAFTSSQLHFPKYNPNSLIQHLRGILKLLLTNYSWCKKKLSFLLHPDCVVGFPFSRSEHCSVWRNLLHYHVRAKLIWGEVAFRAPCGPFYGHVSARLPLIGRHGEPGLDRCLEERHLFGHVLI